jgi:DNA polymerase III alpha subunit
MPKFEDRMVGRMIARGYDPQFAQSCFDQIKGSAAMAFLRAMRLHSPSLSMYRHG